MTDIDKYIRNQIVTSSSDVIKFCVTTLGLTDSNARKRLQRLSKDIYKIKGLCADRQSILYHKDNWYNDEYYNTLVDVLKHHAKQHHAIIVALKAHSGSVPINKLASYSLSPVEHVIKHKCFDLLIEDLKRLHLVEDDGEYYYLTNLDANEKRAKAQNLIQTITIEQFNEWARNIGLISYDATQYNSNFSGYQFGLTAPAYIKSLISIPKQGKIIPAFVVSDILLSPFVNVDQVDFLVKKLENISMRNQKAKFIPFFITNSHDSEVYQKLKTNGIIVGNIDELFGNQYTETIMGILDLIENAGAILKTNPQQYLKLIDSIERLAIGKTNNLKGSLFEMAVGYYHGLFCQTLELDKKIYHDKKEREIDVYASYQHKIIIAECKGYSSRLSKEYITTWLSDKIPVIREWVLSNDSLKNKEIIFELWSTGGFDKDAEEQLAFAKQNTKRYKIEYYSYPDMNILAKEHAVPHFQKLLKTYYCKD